MILKRVLEALRAAWPETRILLRGDGHFSNPGLMALTLDDPDTDFIFALTGNRALTPFVEHNRKVHALRCENARRAGSTVPHRTRSSQEVDYCAGSWPKRLHHPQSRGDGARGQSPLRGDLAGTVPRAQKTSL
jgi:hypothetical protein